jgi:hypothetical protein
MAESIVRTYQSAADYTAVANIGRIVTMTNANEVTVSGAGASAYPLGVIVDAPTTTTVAICVAGLAKCRAGAAFTAGTTLHNMVSSDASGDGVPTASSDFFVGRFIGQADIADGDLFDVIVQPGWYEDED